MFKFRDADLSPSADAINQRSAQLTVRWLLWLKDEVAIEQNNADGAGLIGDAIDSITDRPGFRELDD